MRSARDSVVLLCLAAAGAAADPVPFDSDQWTIEAQTSLLMEYQGKQALLLKGGQARLEAADFRDGVIEFDIAFSELRTFTGVRWRIGDDGSFEDFYFRPHLSGMPDANQYMPVYNRSASWQLYHGEPYSAPLRYRANEWMHVMLVIAGDQGELYLDSEEPVHAFVLKGPARSGALALYAADLAPIYFADFSYREEDRTSLQAMPALPPPGGAGTVRAWSVSSAFAEGALAGAPRLDPGLKRSLSWQTLEAEATGITNLARTTALAEGRNTVIARFNAVAGRDQVKLLRFGYSDRTKVYVNDALVYAGDNGYRSRDYRYLGTIGLFDAVAVQLGRGMNEIAFAVAEDFGGWGVMAQFEDPAGITVSIPTER